MSQCGPILFCALGSRPILDDQNDKSVAPVRAILPSLLDVPDGLARARQGLANEGLKGAPKPTRLIYPLEELLLAMATGGFDSAGPMGCKSISRLNHARFSPPLRVDSKARYLSS